MTDEERLLAEAEDCHRLALSRLADEAGDRGEATLRLGYLWLMKNRKWPVMRHNGVWHWLICCNKYPWLYGSSIPLSIWIDTKAARRRSLGRLLRETAQAVGECLLREKAIRKRKKTL